MIRGGGGDESMIWKSGVQREGRSAHAVRERSEQPIKLFSGLLFASDDTSSAKSWRTAAVLTSSEVRRVANCHTTMKKKNNATHAERSMTSFGTMRDRENVTLPVQRQLRAILSMHAVRDIQPRRK